MTPSTFSLALLCQAAPMVVTALAEGTHAGYTIPQQEVAAALNACRTYVQLQFKQEFGSEATSETCHLLLLIE